MKALKIIGAIILILLCVSLTVYGGSVLLTALPMGRTQPVQLDTNAVFEELPKEEPVPEEEPLPEEEPAPEEEPLPEEELPEEEPVPEEPAEPAPDELLQEEPGQEDKEPALNLAAWEPQARAYMEGMSLEEKVWQLMITTPDKLAGEKAPTRAGEHTQNFLKEKPVGGVCYFAENLVDQEQVKVMLLSTQTYSKTPLFLAVDEEGGRVSRCGANEKIDVTHFDAAAMLGDTGSKVDAYNMGKTLASELGELGFNLDFAPVADVITNPNNTEIGDRSYSTDPVVAGTMVEGMVQGFQAGSFGSCLKHFPGHGSTEADSHEGLSTSTRTIDELRETEWVPFQMGIDAGVPFVMVGHQTNRNLSELPASLSSVVMAYLREELGFRGIIVTDSLKMGAIANEYTSAQAAVMALQAGADMLLMPNDLGTAYEGITQAIMNGTLTEARIDESVLRILETKYMLGIME